MSENRIFGQDKSLSVREISVFMNLVAVPHSITY
jgi:hypothetical protein